MTKETSLFEKCIETGKHGIVYGIGSVLTPAISIILLPVYTSYLTTSDYGILGLIVITGSIVVSISSLGIVSGLFRSYYDYDDEENRRIVISTALFLMLTSCIILFICGFFLSKYISLLLLRNANYEIHILMIIIISIVGILNSLPFVIFRARKKSVQYVVFQVSFLILNLGLVIYFVVMRNWGILGILMGQLLAGVISLNALYVYIRKDITLKFSKPEAKKIMHFGIPLVPANLASFIFNYADRYMLVFYCTLSMVGLYTLGYQFGMIIVIIFITPIKLVWGPMFLSVKDHNNAKDFYSIALTYAILLGCFLFLVLALLSKEAIHILSNKSYWDAYIIVPLIALSYILCGLHDILNVGVSLKRKTKMLALYAFIGAVANILLNFVLIPKYGILGAAYATLFSFTLITFLVFIINKKLISIKYEWSRIIKIILITSIVFFIGYSLTINNVLYSILLKCTILSLYFPALYIIKFFLRDEINSFKNLTKYALCKLKLKSN